MLLGPLLWALLLVACYGASSVFDPFDMPLGMRAVLGRDRLGQPQQPLRQRPRRNRKSAAVRALVREQSLQASNFIYPLFIQESGREAVPSMPGVFRLA